MSEKKIEVPEAAKLWILVGKALDTVYNVGKVSQLDILAEAKKLYIEGDADLAKIMALSVLTKLNDYQAQFGIDYDGYKKSFMHLADKAETPLSK